MSFLYPVQGVHALPGNGAGQLATDTYSVCGSVCHYIYMYTLPSPIHVLAGKQSIPAVADLETSIEATGPLIAVHHCWGLDTKQDCRTGEQGVAPNIAPPPPPPGPPQF
jgi:hypothetical protein